MHPCIGRNNSTTKINVKNHRIRWLSRWSLRSLPVPWFNNSRCQNWLWSSWQRFRRSSLPWFWKMALLLLISYLIGPAYRWQREVLGCLCLAEPLLGTTFCSISTEKESMHSHVGWIHKKTIKSEWVKSYLFEDIGNDAWGGIQGCTLSHSVSPVFPLRDLLHEVQLSNQPISII